MTVHVCLAGAATDRQTDLALWHVVPAKGAHDEARVARVRLGAVAGVSRAGDELALLAVLLLLRHLGRRRGCKCEKRA